MKIIKKSGIEEEFNILKIRSSVSNASNEINMPLTDSDLNVITKEVTSILSVLNRETTSSYEIFAIVLNVLNKLKFKSICNAYLKGNIEI